MRHQLPIIYLDYFTLNSSIHDHNTRGRSLLHSQIRASYGHKTIHFLGSLLWNALPPDLKELSNTKMFKLKLKNVSLVSVILSVLFFWYGTLYIYLLAFSSFLYFCVIFCCNLEWR